MPSDFGINVKDHSADFSAVVSRSRDIAGGMSKGVEFLMKKNKIEVIMGTGKLKAAGKLEVTDEKGGVKEVTAKSIIVATGARSRELTSH